MRLKTSRKFCTCGGTIAHYKERYSNVTIYTQTGPIRMDHLESRCKTCNKGWYYGYTSDCSSEDQKGGTVSYKKQFKIYEEDCLESEVIFPPSLLNVLVRNSVSWRSDVSRTRSAGPHTQAKLSSDSADSLHRVTNNRNLPQSYQS